LRTRSIGVIGGNESFFQIFLQGAWIVTQSLCENVWLSIAIGLIVYIVDYYLTQYEVYLYHTHAQEYLVLKGRYERTHVLKRVKENKWLPSTTFIVTLLIQTLGIYAGWFALVKQLFRPEVFSFLMGGLILLRVASALIHFRYISLYQFARDEGYFKGKLEFSERVSFTLPYMEMYGFTSLFLILFLFHGGWFLPGGILTCFIVARRHRDWVRTKT
jgi:hypothetical protein